MAIQNPGCAKIGYVRPPKAQEPVFLGLVDKPVSLGMCYALPRDRVTNIRIWKSGFINLGGHVKWGADCLT